MLVILRENAVNFFFHFQYLRKVKNGNVTVLVLIVFSKIASNRIEITGIWILTFSIKTHYFLLHYSVAKRNEVSFQICM